MKPETMNTLYTIGYSGRSLDEIETICSEVDALLLDIRYKPYSRKYGFSKAALARFFGANYLHLRELGNINYDNNKPIQIYEPDAGLVLLGGLLRHRPVIMLCVCRNYQRCHRQEVAYLAREHFPGLQVIHITPAGDITLPPLHA